MSERTTTFKNELEERSREINPPEEKGTLSHKLSEVAHTVNATLKETIGIGFGNYSSDIDRQKSSLNKETVEEKEVKRDLSPEVGESSSIVHKISEVAHNVNASLKEYIGVGFGNYPSGVDREIANLHREKYDEKSSLDSPIMIESLSESPLLPPKPITESFNQNLNNNPPLVSQQIKSIASNHSPSGTHISTPIPPPPPQPNNLHSLPLRAPVPSSFTQQQELSNLPTTSSTLHQQGTHSDQSTTSSTLPQQQGTQIEQSTSSTFPTSTRSQPISSTSTSFPQQQGFSNQSTSTSSTLPQQQELSNLSTTSSTLHQQQGTHFDQQTSSTFPQQQGYTVQSIPSISKQQEYTMIQPTSSTLPQQQGLTSQSTTSFHQQPGFINPSTSTIPQQQGYYYHHNQPISSTSTSFHQQPGFINPSTSSTLPQQQGFSNQPTSSTFTQQQGTHFDQPTSIISPQGLTTQSSSTYPQQGSLSNPINTTPNENVPSVGQKIPRIKNKITTFLQSKFPNQFKSNQSISQGGNVQPITQPTMNPVSYSSNVQPITQPTTQPTTQPITQPITQSTMNPVSYSSNVQPITQPITQPTTYPLSNEQNLTRDVQTQPSIPLYTTEELLSQTNTPITTNTGITDTNLSKKEKKSKKHNKDY